MGLHSRAFMVSEEAAAGGALSGFNRVAIVTGSPETGSPEPLWGRGWSTEHGTGMELALVSRSRVSSAAKRLVRSILGQDRR